METHQYSNFALISQHLIISICALLLPLAASAQTQQGYVRTLGRPDAKGVALSGVAVRVKGEHNAVLSGADGSFAIALPRKKNGEAYVLQQVRKAGYELNEKGVLGRQFAFSDKVPLTLVMVSTSQLQADKQRIENTAYQVAERNYKTKMEALERQREAGSLAAEQYRAEIQDLQDKFEKYQSLIDDLAEHYAHTDYDLLNEHDREINLCIERGDLDRADSLIHDLFDPVDVLRRNKEALAHIDQSEAQARQLLAQANEDMAAILKQQAKDAEYLYQLYTIALARYDNEKAAQYIQTRAELDTTNVEWQVSAGQFLYEYMAKYENAIILFNRALRQTLLQNPEDNHAVGARYIDIGLVFAEKGDYPSSIKFYQKAIDLIENISGEEKALATAYNNIGYSYYLLTDYPKALEYLERGLEIRTKLFGEESKQVAESCNNIGNVYYMQKDYSKAEYYHYRAMEIHYKNPNVSPFEVATTSHNLGLVLNEQGKYDTALEMSELALNIRLKILGEMHPEVATSYNSIGSIYHAMKDYPKALEYFMKTLNILLKTLGNNHPNVGISYNNIGSVYFDSKDYKNALIYFTKGMQVMMNVFGEDHPNTQTLLHSMDNTFQAVIRENPGEPQWQQIYEGFKYSHKLK